MAYWLNLGILFSSQLSALSSWRPAPKKNEKKERPLGRAGPPALLFFIFFRAPGAGPAAMS